jgi:hypothetical protein
VCLMRPVMDGAANVAKNSGRRFGKT